MPMPSHPWAPSRNAAQALCLVAVAWTVGCSDESPTQPQWGLSEAAVLVSNPVSTGTSQSIAGRASLSAIPEVAYVSLPPGSVPAGVAGSIRIRGAGATVRTMLIDGGFDPVPVPAAVGDTLDVEIFGGSGTIPVARATRVIRAPRRPIVVRTSPASGKRHVPLNTVIVVVFSEPMDPGTFTTSSMRLLRDGQPVPGRLEFQSPHNLTATFVPETPLLSNARYDLLVSEQVRDLDGEPLEAPVTAGFTTTVLPLLLTTQGAMIVQNDPSIGCTPHRNRGHGFRLAFQWSPGLAGADIVASRLHVMHPDAQFAVVDVVLSDSTFDYVSCNSFVIDRNLYGWEWQVSFQRATGEWTDWFGPGVFDFLPCRLGDGRPCNAPPE